MQQLYLEEVDCECISVFIEKPKLSEIAQQERPSVLFVQEIQQ